jgi:hypothetical protein
MEFLNGFYKVEYRNSGIAVAVFYNPETLEEIRVKTDDIDYDAYAPQAYDGRLKNRAEADEVSRMPIDEKVKSIWLHRMGIITEGDTVIVSRGRKVPKGTIGTLIRTSLFHDRFGRLQNKYAHILLVDGTEAKTSLDNCDLMWEGKIWA